MVKKIPGFWSIGQRLFNHILEIIPKGSTMIELGSGKKTADFCNYYTVYSIEHDPKWVGTYHDNYIYAPIKNYGDYRWYDREKIAAGLPTNYNCILIDGPPRRYGRMGFFYNLDLFKTDIPIFIHDLHRLHDRKLCKQVANAVDNPYEVHWDFIWKKYGVIKP